MSKPSTIRYVTSENNLMELVVYNDSMKSYPLHNHVSMYTIGYVLSGELALETNAGTETCQEDSYFLLPPYTPHAMTALQPYSMLSICIHKDMVAQLDSSSLYSEILKLTRQAQLPDTVKREQFLIIVQSIINTISYPAQTPQSDNSTIMNQLEMYPEEKISIDEMAKETCTSKFQFIRNFKRDVGLTPHQFQLQNQVRKAQKDLLQTENITEVALNSGFFDQSHFIRHFEKIVQLTPTEYKSSCEKIPKSEE